LFSTDHDSRLDDVERLDDASGSDSGECAQEVGLHWFDHVKEISPESVGFFWGFGHFWD